MKATGEQLELLLELQSNIYSQRKLVAEAKELAGSSAIETARGALAEATGLLSEQRSRVEDVERDIRRLESDVELVQKRLDRDTERLNQSSNPKDIAGMEHEIQTLKSRMDALETSELELLELRDSSLAEQESLVQKRAEAEAELERIKSETALKLEALKAENSELVATIERLKAVVPAELAELFDKKLQRGAAVGRLTGSSCSACNMSLNSTAMAEISRVPRDELASCSECSAMLVRA